MRTQTIVDVSQAPPTALLQAHGRSQGAPTSRTGPKGLPFSSQGCVGLTQRWTEGGDGRWTWAKTLHSP